MNEDLKKAISDFRLKQEVKTFSGRHPELGKMVNCQVCGLRHRSVKICQQKFAVELKPLDYLTGLTKFQVIGRASFKGKRVNPHHSKKLLQLYERTILLFPSHNGVWPSTEKKSAEQVATEMARREARQGLEKERAERRDRKQAVQHHSRQVNRHLVPSNTPSPR